MNIKRLFEVIRTNVGWPTLVKDNIELLPRAQISQSNSEFQSWLYQAFLSLGFLFCKMEKIIVPTAPKIIMRLK